MSTTLPTNYKDPILDTDVNERKRYNMITNDDGTVSFEEVTTYTQEPSKIGAGAFNTQNQEINGKIDDEKRLTSSDDVKAITEEGYIVDAKVIREHMENTEKSETEIYKKIDESSTDAASNLKKLIKLQTVKSESISVSASGEYSGSLSVAATGYTPIGVLSFNSGNTGLALIKIETSTSGTVYFSLKNVTAKAVSGTVRLVVLYIRNDYFSWLV